MPKKCGTLGSTLKMVMVVSFTGLSELDWMSHARVVVLICKYGNNDHDDDNNNS